MRACKIAILTSVAAVAFAFSAASAAPRQKPVVRAAEVSSQTHTRRVRQARAPTRITVTPRSFLDPGTEVLPGQEKFTDYAFPPSQSTPLQVVSGPTAPAGWQNPHWPLPGPFDLPSKYNPVPNGSGGFGD